jgi:alpha-ketoglutarate-dependent taurine dioxygenase
MGVLRVGFDHIRDRGYAIMFGHPAFPEDDMPAATSTEQKLEIRPLHPLFGAEIIGLDLREPLDDETFAKVLDTFNSYSVVLFRRQDISDDQHVAFSRRFGELEKTSFAIAAPNPYIYRLANVDDQGNVLAMDAVKRTFLEVNARWHTDSSFRAIPAMASILSGKEVPEGGGETCFASMRVAYKAMPEGRKQSLEGMRAIHSYAYSVGLFGEVGVTQEEKDAVPPVEHPIVRTHAPTGDKSLYVSGHIESIVGMPVEEGRLLAKELIDWCTRPEYIYTHRWQQNDLIMWDNRCVLHRATSVPSMHKRIMHRTTIAGEGPVA